MHQGKTACGINAGGATQRDQRGRSNANTQQFTGTARRNDNATVDPTRQCNDGGNGAMRWEIGRGDEA